SIIQDIPASAVACAYQMGDISVGQRQAASAKACTHRTWHVHIWQMTSANGMQNQPMPSRISRGVCASAGRHRPRPAPIGQR
ncbi:hypothetical protein B5P42_31310, partial [Bacillus sp. SRB_331]